MIAEAGASHSVYVTWRKDGELVGWYVNLEEPWRESPFGFDTTDHLLDVWIEPDRSWRWKDEDELAEAVEIGLFTPAKADAIRAEGERAIERIEAWSTPFDEGWETWRQGPDWPLPELPTVGTAVNGVRPCKRAAANPLEAPRDVDCSCAFRPTIATLLERGLTPGHGLNGRGLLRGRLA